MAFPIADDVHPVPMRPELLESCPRCGAEFDGDDCLLREVNLSVASGDREWEEAGYECARCGWCTEALPGEIQ